MRSDNKQCPFCKAQKEHVTAKCKKCGSFSNLLILVTGPNLSLKSTISNYLKKRLRFPLLESAYLSPTFDDQGNLDQSLRLHRRDILSNITNAFVAYHVPLIVDAAFHSKTDRQKFFQKVNLLNPVYEYIIVCAVAKDSDVRELRRLRRNKQALNTEKQAVSPEEVRLSLERYEMPLDDAGPAGERLPVIYIRTDSYSCTCHNLVVRIFRLVPGVTA